MGIRRWNHVVQTGFRRVVAEPKREDTAKHRHCVLVGSPASARRARVAAATGSAHIRRPLVTLLPVPFPRLGRMMADCLDAVSLRAFETRHSSRRRLHQLAGADYNGNKTLIGSSKDTSSTAGIFALSVSSCIAWHHQEKLTEYPQNRHSPRTWGKWTRCIGSGIHQMDERSRRVGRSVGVPVGRGRANRRWFCEAFLVRAGGLFGPQAPRRDFNHQPS